MELSLFFVFGLARLVSAAPSCVCSSAAPVVPAPSPTSTFAPHSGKTLLGIGQNYLNEWEDFAAAMKVPAGISVDGDIYDGALNSDSQNLLHAYASKHSGYVEVGLSWKDDMVNHGYSIYQGASLCHDIANGKYDSNLHNLAAYLAKYKNVHYMLRIDYEVSGNMHANTDAYGFNENTFDTSAYPRAFAHIRSIISQKVSNIDYVYHSVRGGAHMLYPGDSVVDFIGFSIFNNDVCLTVSGTSNCAGSTLDPNVLLDIAFSPKPKWIAESSVQPPAVNDPTVFIEYLERVKDMVEKYDFRGWTYINSAWNAHGWDAQDWGDSRVEVCPEVKEWFERNILGNERYVWGS